jgi:hypothetical protein
VKTFVTSTARFLTFSFILFLFCAGTGIVARENTVAFSGEAETVFASPFSADRNLTEARTALKARLGAYAGDTELGLTFNAEYNPLIPSRTDAALEEAWIRFSPTAERLSFSLSLGRQFISWGAADGLILTDIVCPQNLSAYAGLDFSKSRLPVDGLGLRLGFSGFSFGDFSIEALWLPVFTAAKLPLEQDNPLNAVLFPAFVSPLTESSVESAKPKTIADGEYGIRLSFYSPFFDLSLCGFYGWNDIPYYSGSVAGAPPYSLHPAFNRILMAGGDMSIPAGDLLFRLEAAYTWGGRFNPDDAAITMASGNLTPVEKDRLQMLAGLDWNPGSWTITAQYYEDILPQKAGGLERDWRKNAATLSVSRSFFHDTLSLSASGYLGLNDFDTAAGAEAAWKLSDELELSLGTDLFFGGIDGGGDYAVYEDISCIWIRARYRF